MKEDYHMKNKLLVTTALVGLAFASSAMAADITTNKQLSEYAAKAEAHNWQENVTIDAQEDESLKIEQNYIEAKELNINSDVEISGQGVFLSGDNATNVAKDATVTITNKGHLLSAYDLDHNNRAVNIDGTVKLNGGAIRAASSADGTHYSQINVNGTVAVEGENNTIASRVTNVKDGGKFTIAKDSSLDLVGDMTRDPVTGFVSTDEGAKKSTGIFAIAKGGSLENAGTVAANATSVKNNGSIKNTGTFTLTDYESDGGSFHGAYTQNGGSLVLSNNATITTDNQSGADNDKANKVSITNAEKIEVTNGSAIDTSFLEINGDADNKTEIIIGGNNPNAGRETDANEQWRNDAYILSYNDAEIENADITIKAGGHLQQAATGDNADSAKPHIMTITNSTVAVETGGSMISSSTKDGTSSFELAGESSVDLNGGIINGKISVGDTSEINVNNAGSTIKTLAGEGTLNINANTSVSTLFGSASKIGTLAVKEGSTFILNSSDKVSADPDNDIEAKDAVNLTASTMEVSGTAIVADNGNSIAETNVNKGGILDLGYNTFSSDVTMDAGSTLNVGVKNDDDASDGKLTHGKIDGTLTVTDPAEGAANASMNLIIAADTKLGEKSKIDLASGSENGLGNLVVNNNLLYNLEGVDDDGKITGSEITVSKKDSSEVAAGVAANGANGNQAGTIAAFVDGLSGNAQADNITNQISTLVQSGNVKGAARLAKEVAPVAAPVAQSQVTETTNQVFGAVATRLSGGSVSSAAEGKSSGDSVFERAAMWVQGLFNKSKYDGSNDFKTDSTGLALGAEKYLNSDVKVGAGYAYTNSDVKQGDRKIDVDTHTAFVYGEYKPSDWYVNGIASYNWGDYDEKKYGGLSGKYDVNSIALQAMTGYDFHMNGAVVTPEAGLRYINIHQDSYTDTAGQRVSENSSDYLTGIVGAKIKKDYTLSNGMNIRPEARLAMTYDLVNDNSNASVMLANGSAYQVRGEALDRFGVEAGVGLTAEVDDNVEVSLGYEGKFRDHYKDHTGLLNAKYKF
jgi:outer membrane autotransporter barrel domain protein